MHPFCQLCLWNLASVLRTAGCDCSSLYPGKRDCTSQTCGPVVLASFQVDILMFSWLVCGFWCNTRTKRSPKGTKITCILWLRPLGITRVSQAPHERNLFPRSAEAFSIGRVQIRVYVYLLIERTALSTCALLGVFIHEFMGHLRVLLKTPASMM